MTKPKRARPVARQTRPDTMAMAPASATARSGLPFERGRTTARIRGAREESGPRTRIRLGPKTAYASSGTIVAYSP